ncbi:MAG: heparinase II/III-family protein [Planctomycetes bacterium]|nr:heparinase II/III-family protein [Planctomycetota bacterium]
MKLRPHPRLYVTPAQIARLRDPLRDPALRGAATAVVTAADEALKSTDVPYTRDVHNEHLIRARNNQGRVVSLLVRWFQTGDRRFRDAAVAHIDAMAKWEYWSWITWRQGNADPMAIYDLSYGENATTIAIAYDWLRADLTPAERGRFLNLARERVFKPFLHHTKSKKPGEKAWWYGHPQTNWNTVCAGGAGMLALAMLGEVSEARPVIPRAEWSFRQYMLELDKTGGAWPEGIGYWNYGMRYAFMYLLSHENATGKRHPLLHRAATRATLRFPVELCPNRVPCSFGDVNHFHPMPFHFEAARRLVCGDVLAMLEAQVPDLSKRTTGWPDAAEMLLLHPRRIPKTRGAAGPVARLYKGQDWFILADRLTAPKLYLSGRGGTTKVPHSHLDLLSFHCVVNDESMVTNLMPGEYLDTTFSARRWDIFEMGPGSKNTILINGVGVTPNSSVTTRPIRFPGAIGYRLDATSAYGDMRDGKIATFCGRVFLLLDAGAILIVDRVELPHVGRVESRMHTFTKAAVTKSGAALRGKRQRMSVAYACDRPAGLFTAQGAPTTPGVGATVLRWCSQKQELAFTMATMLVPGATPGGVKITAGKGGFEVAVSTRRRRRVLRFDNQLSPR